MKVVHIVIVKFKPEVTEEAKELALKEVVALKDTIPVIESATAGKNFTDRGKGYEYGWVVNLNLEKREDLAALYSNHPSHVEYLASHKVNFEEVLAFDYEI